MQLQSSGWTSPEQSIHHSGIIPITVTPPMDLEPFERAREKVWNNLTTMEKNELGATCTIEDVWKTTVDIQEKQGKRRELGNMNKIRPYLDCLRCYDGVITIFISSNPGILALIWVHSPPPNSAVKTDVRGN